TLPAGGKEPRQAQGHHIMGRSRPPSRHRHNTKRLTRQRGQGATVQELAEDYDRSTSPPRTTLAAPPVSSKISRLWTRYRGTSWGQRIYAFFLPFTARPSQFVQHKEHPVYGKLSVISVAPLIFASFIFGKANITLWNTMLLATHF